jgi:TP901 family phage tail tape measure protein
VADKLAKIRLTADSRGLAIGLKEAQKKMAAFGRGLGKGFGGSFGKSLRTGLPKGLKGAGKRLGGGLKSVLGMGGSGIGGILGGMKTAVGLGGVGGLAILLGNEAHKAFQFEKSLTRLRIASSGAIKDLSGLRKEVTAVSTATGVSREEVLAGVNAYVVLTGDTKTATEQMELFARVAKGQGAAIEDVAAASAALRQNLKIDPRDFEQAMSILVRGGKMGAVELKDMANLMAGLAPRAEAFKGGSGLKGLADLGAAFQLTRQGFKDPEEAATGMESLMGSIVGHAKQLKAIGVQVYDKDPKTGVMHLKGFQQIVQAIGNSKTWKKGDLTRIQKVLGRKEAMQTLRMLLKVPGAWEEISAGTLKAKDVSEDYFAYNTSTAGKLEMLFNTLKNSIAEAFTPERIDAFGRAIGGAMAAMDALLTKAGQLRKFIWETDAEMKADLHTQAEKALDEGDTPEDWGKWSMQPDLGVMMRQVLKERAKAAEETQYQKDHYDVLPDTPEGIPGITDRDVAIADRFAGRDQPIVPTDKDPDRHPRGPVKYKVGDPRLEPEVDLWHPTGPMPAAPARDKHGQPVIKVHVAVLPDSPFFAWVNNMRGRRLAP